MAEVLADITADVTVKILVEIFVEILAKLEAWVEIRWPKELEVLNGLRLPVEDAVEAAAEILAEVLVELTGETELAWTEPEAQVEIRQLKVQVEIQ